MSEKDYLRNDIAHKIASEIISKQLYPGERLTEASLCERFEVSRTPVREALMLLEKKGFVENRKNSGAIVRKISENNIREINDIYAALEGRALELSISVHQFTETDIDYLEKLQTGMEHATNEGEWRKLNIEFHTYLRKRCPNQELNSILIELDEKTLFYRKGGLPPGSSGLKVLLDDHREILSAIKAKDAAKARYLLENHVRNGRMSLSSEDFEIISQVSF